MDGQRELEFGKMSWFALIHFDWSISVNVFGPINALSITHILFNVSIFDDATKWSDVLFLLDWNWRILNFITFHFVSFDVKKFMAPKKDWTCDCAQNLNLYLSLSRALYSIQFTSIQTIFHIIILRESMWYSRENRYTKRFGSFDDFYRQFAHIRRKKNSRFCAWLVTSCWKHCCCKWTLIRSLSSGTAAEKLFRNKNKWSMFSGWKKSGAELLGKHGIACFCAY